jgi:small subunit ribosomal protein S6
MLHTEIIFFNPKKMTDENMDENPETTSTEEEVAMPIEMQRYEMMAIFSAELSEEQIKKAIKTVKALLGDDIFYEEIWGMRDFAYQIKGQSKGYYVVWNFTQDPQAVKDMEAVLKLNVELVRYLTMKIPANYKPVTMKEMDAGMDELRKEKEEKRGETKTAAQRRVEKKEDKPAPKAAPTAKKEEKAAPAAAPKAAPAEKEAPAKKEEAGKKSLDEKLEDIMSDADLGL